IAGARHLGADDAHRSAFRISAQDAYDSDADRDLNAAGDDGLLRLAAALRVENFEVEPMLLEYAGTLADIGYAGIPQPALADGEAQRILRERGARDCKARDHAEGESCNAFHPMNLPRLRTSTSPAQASTLERC